MPLVTGPGDMQGVQIPDMVGGYARMQQLQQMQAEAPLRAQIMQQTAAQGQQTLQQGQLDIQQKQRALKDQQAMDAAMQQWTMPKQPAAAGIPAAQGTQAAAGVPTAQPTAQPPAQPSYPDYDKLADLAQQNGASYDTVSKLRQHAIDMRDKASQIAKDDAQTGQDTANTMKTQNTARISALSGVANLPDEQIVQGLQAATQNMTQQGLLDAQHLPIYQQMLQSGDPATIRKQLGMQITSMGGFNQLLDDQQKKIETDQKQQAAQYGPTGPAADSKYTFLQSRLAQNQPITAGDQAWIKGYEKQKTLVPTARFELTQGARNAAAGAAPGYTGNTGEDFLATLTPGMAAQVKAGANGDIAIPPPGARNPQAQQLRTAVLTYDPTYTDARYIGKKNFKTSGDAQNIVQLSTAMEHADHAIANSAKVGFAPMLGNPKFESTDSSAYMQDAEFLTGEVGKLVKNGALTVDESNKISSGLTSSRQSVRDAALHETMDLLGGKVGGVFQKYKTATGQDLPVNEFFDAKSQQRLQKYGFVNQAAGQGSTGNSGGAAAPAGMQQLTSGGKVYHIPAAQVAEFKKDHPDAR